MKEHILSSQAFRAILEGRQDQLRSLMIPQPPIVDGFCAFLRNCPFGGVGSLVLVRERYTDIRHEPQSVKVKITRIKVEKGISGWVWAANFQRVDNNGDAA